MSTSKADQDLSDRLVQTALNDPSLSTPTHLSSRVFVLLSVLLHSPSAAAQRKKLVRQIKTVYLFEVKNGEGEVSRWWVDMKKTGNVRLLPSFTAKAPRKPDVIVKVGDKDLVGLATGRLSPQKLYAAKRLSIHGDLDRAFLAVRILNTEREKLEALSPATTTARREIWGEHKPLPTAGAEERERNREGSGGRVRAKL
ncbi:hypothetical protein JCM6882_007392 [Rhodosporidiobolus microsporus]